MAFDFPATPSVGQQFPVTPVAGQPLYKWDGEKWAVAGAGALPIYADGSVPMSAQLKLAGDPVALLDAADKNYVDTLIGTAAPFAAMGSLGLQINGAFEINQFSFGSGITVPNGVSTGSYFCDMWQALASYASGSFGAVQSANGGFPGFEYSGLLQCSPAPTSLAAGDYALLQTIIEGYRCARLGWGIASGGIPITIGFWIYATRAGTANIAVRNAAAPSPTRAYIAPFTVNNASTWEYKTITIPGDVTGTWNKSNGHGMILSWCFRCGSTNAVGTPNAWAAAGNFAAPGISNFFQANMDGVWITGVGVYPGNQAPSAARSMYATRHWSDELQSCKRYLHRVDIATDPLIGQAYSTTHALFAWFHPVTMRAGPSWAGSGAFQVRGANASGIAVGTIIFNNSFPDFSEIDCAVASGLVAGNAAALLINSGYLQADARF